MRCARAKGFVIAFVVLIFTSTTFGALIENIAGELDDTNWYYGNGDYFKPNYLSGGDAQISILDFTTQGQQDYYMMYGTFAMTPSALVQDKTPNGGLAYGIFASGATLTINGDLWDDSLTTIVASGDLIEAVVTAQWDLRELSSPPAVANTVNGRAFFHIIGGALSNASLNSNGLFLSDFYLDFTFPSTTPAVTDFSTTLGNATYSCYTPSIQGGAIPEPASIAILAFGGLALIRKIR
jgi:hypothetical protein